jgi:hypothetical protein
MSAVLDPQAMASLSAAPPDSAPPPVAGTNVESSPVYQGALSDYRSDTQALADLAKDEQASAPKPPAEAPPQHQPGITSTAPFLIAMAALGGKALGLHATTMLGATNGMVSGLIQGNEQKYKDQVAAYNDSYKQYREKFDQQQKIFNEMRQVYKGRVDADLKALTFARQVTGDNAKVDDRAVKNYLHAQEIDAKWQDTQSKIDYRAGELALQKRKLQEQIDNEGATLTPEAAMLMASRLLNGEKSSEVFSNIGRGKQGAANITVVQNLFAQLAEGKGMDPKIQETAKSIATKKMQLAAESRVLSTEGAKLGAREASISPTENSILGPGGFAEQAEQAVNGLNLPSFKKEAEAKKFLAEQRMDPKVTAYTTRIAELRAEYAIVLAKGGVSSVHAQEEAAKVVPEIITPQTWPEVKKAMQQGIAASKRGVKESIAGITGNTPDAPPVPTEPTKYAYGQDGKPMYQLIKGQWVPIAN